jgi:uncharacterized membrane protein YphA (DoxX/SURF4 family)
MLIAVSLLLTAVCILPAVGKIQGQPKVRESAERFGIPWPRYRLIAIPELAAAVGVLIGLFWRPAGLIAAAGMTLLLVGALAAHWRAHDPARDAVPALVALAIAVAYQAIAYAG